MKKIAVVIPCYRVTQHIIGVISKIGPEVQTIYVVDDCCPDSSGDFVSQHCSDMRVKVMRHEVNLGVGGAVMTAYRQALADAIDIVVKIDGDGQMHPGLLPQFVQPLLHDRADYAKGNRFFYPSDARRMPIVRLIGNIGLSFVTRMSSGYWAIFDPTNGYTAITKEALSLLEFDKIHNRYFFESDMLFRLNLIHAVVTDIPMKAVYADEESHLSVGRSLGEFAWFNLRNTTKRIGYQYFLRDFSVASLELVVGSAAMSFGVIVGVMAWIASAKTGIPATSGTVMLSAMPIILGLQLLLAFLSHDIHSQATEPVSTKLRAPDIHQWTDPQT